jgi:EpsI family protein
VNRGDEAESWAASRIGTTVLCAALLAVGGFAWWLQMQPERVVDASALRTLPRSIAGWEGRDIPIADTVESELRADFNLQRAYVGPSGELIWIYVGYYGTNRGGRPEHTPRFCYTGAGWGIESTQQLTVDPDAGLHVNEYHVHREGERRLVHFWYRSHRRTGMTSGLDQNLDRMAGRLFDGRADGALIRVSTRIEDDDEEAARARLLDFVAKVDALIGERWPVETSVARGWGFVSGSLARALRCCAVKVG